VTSTSVCAGVAPNIRWRISDRILRHDAFGRIVAGPDGALWFVENGFLTAAVGRITAGHVTEYSNGITPLEQPIDLVAGKDGAIWFTEYKGAHQYENDAKIGRITASGAITEYSGGLNPKSGPTGITLGPDGKVWFVETVTNKLGRVAY
jgi:virginiamycin B lyase